jgi:hypothetical protein
MGKRDWSWAILGLIALVFRYIAVRNPEKTDEIYSRIFFPGIRNVIDMSLGKLSFPSVYLFIASVCLIIGIGFFRFLKRKGWKSKTFYAFRFLLNGVGAVVFFSFFYGDLITIELQFLNSWA